MPLPALAGDHQLDNAAGAIALVQCLQPLQPVSWQAIERALCALKLPGRMESRGRFLLDVGHNAESAQAIALQLKQLTKQPVLWLVGILGDKPIETIAEALGPVVHEAITCSLPGPRGLSAQALAARLGHTGMTALAGGEPAAALALALQRAAPEQLILISGSFLTVAAISPLISHD